MKRGYRGYVAARTSVWRLWVLTPVATFYVFVVSPPAPQSTTLYMYMYVFTKKYRSISADRARPHSTVHTDTRTTDSSIEIGRHTRNAQYTLYTATQQATELRSEKGETRIDSASAFAREKNVGEGDLYPDIRRQKGDRKATGATEAKLRSTCSCLLKYATW